jgi:DNA repair exonuclease SbcCD ATPase subunit
MPREYNAMEENWFLESIEIRGSFLRELDLSFPVGLTCIIGPRGSGKSTLAEALRYGMCGLENASKSRADLYRANLAKATVTIRTQQTSDGKSYVVRREGKQPAILTMSDGRALPSVDLDRGTFLPFEGYSSSEIEEIAEERLGPKRRTLLDDLRPEEVSLAHANVSTARRALEANADAICAVRRKLEDLNEQIQTLADAPDRLTALGQAPPATPDTVALQEAARQDHANKLERQRIQSLQSSLDRMDGETEVLRASFDRAFVYVPAKSPSANEEELARIDAEISTMLRSVHEHFSAIRRSVASASTLVAPAAELITTAHRQQEAAYAALREQNKAVGQAIKERGEIEEAVRQLTELRRQKETVAASEHKLVIDRKALRGNYVQLHQRISEVRETIAKELDQAAGENVRIRVRRNADKLEYEQKINEGLFGAGVKNHDSIVERVSRIPPDELAQLVQARDYAEFEATCQFGAERSRRVLDALRSSLDPLQLEILRMEDMISIELNVGSADSPIYKDASELSRGQKCTALLPLLLARRNTPLVIDQPEDNLDNNFVFRTVVETVRRLKQTRQLIFITHNANIPVLGEADLIVVMGSDGRVGRIDKTGTLDECQQEIIDLLEGGWEAFDQRRQRYER